MLKVVFKTDVVRGYLLRQNFTQRHLARRVGMSHQYLAQLLQRRRGPGRQTRARLMRALNLEFDDLFEIVEVAAPDGNRAK